MSTRAEVQTVRSALETVLAPAVATAVLFDAIDRAGGDVPADADEVRALVRGPLATLLERYLGEERAAALVAEILDDLAGPELQVDFEIDIEEGDFDEAHTAEITKVAHPVSVLVFGADPGFGERLLAAIGPERVYAFSVADEAAFRHAAFSANPLFVVIDGLNPPDVRPPRLADAVRALPDAMQCVLWGESSDWGRETRARIEHTGCRLISLSRAEGIEPLLDLVLSRFKRVSTIPPPRV